VPRKEIALQYIHIERHQYKEKKNTALEKKYGFHYLNFEEQIIGDCFGHHSTAILHVILNSFFIFNQIL
jgi:hypothetical protein